MAALLATPMELLDYDLDHHPERRGDVVCKALIKVSGKEMEVQGIGNGPINAFVQAISKEGLKDFVLTDYRSHAVRGGSSSDAAAYVQLRHNDGRILWGVGVDPSIEMAGVKALVSAWNLFR